MRIAIWLSFVCLFNQYSGIAFAETLDNIRAKAELAIGVKADYPPYGFKDGSGNLVGLEADLAADLAKQLGVALKLVPVLSSNRIELLNQGKVDLVIATLSITDERRKEAGIIDPPYYAAGAGVLTRPNSGIEEVSDLAGKTICAVDGNIFWMQVQARLPDIRAVTAKDMNGASQAFLSGNCVALLFNDNLLAYKKQTESARFGNFDLVPLMDIDPLLWAVAVRAGEENSPLGQFASQAVAHWHRSGLLLSLEKKWLGSNTPLLQALNQKWTASSSLRP